MDEIVRTYFNLRALFGRRMKPREAWYTAMWIYNDPKRPR